MTSMIFDLSTWKELTGCSELQALNSIADWLQNNRPQANQFAHHWGVKGRYADHHVSDFLHSFTPGEYKESFPGQYYFALDGNDIVKEGWINYSPLTIN